MRERATRAAGSRRGATLAGGPALARERVSRVRRERAAVLGLAPRGLSAGGGKLGRAVLALGCERGERAEEGEAMGLRKGGSGSGRVGLGRGMLLGQEKGRTGLGFG